MASVDGFDGGRVGVLLLQEAGRKRRHGPRRMRRAIVPRKLGPKGFRRLRQIVTIRRLSSVSLSVLSVTLPWLKRSQVKAADKIVFKSLRDSKAKMIAHLLLQM